MTKAKQLAIEKTIETELFKYVEKTVLGFDPIKGSKIL